MPTSGEAGGGVLPIKTVRSRDAAPEPPGTGSRRVLIGETLPPARLPG